MSAMSGDQAVPEASAEAALEWVESGQRIGLGTGRAAAAFVRALGARVAEGLDIVGVPTSEATAKLAGELGIRLQTLVEAGRLDVTFDGADEVDPQLELIKGYGAAMVREKIVAASSDRLVILVGPEKLVDVLGERGRLPIEVLPFGLSLVQARLEEMGCQGTLRRNEGREPLLTDNGNLVVDAQVAAIEDPYDFDARLLAIPGVLGTGLFVGLADAVIIDRPGGIEIRRRGLPAPE